MYITIYHKYNTPHRQTCTRCKCKYIICVCVLYVCNEQKCCTMQQQTPSSTTIQQHNKILYDGDYMCLYPTNHADEGTFDFEITCALVQPSSLR